jgi:hypothetical protein
MRLARAVAVGVTGVAYLAASPWAGAVPSNNVGVDTTLITRSTAGGLPNGPSAHPVISMDSRAATLLAFDSAATNLITQATGGGSNVYFVRRAQPFDSTGSPWVAGPIQLASQGLGGQPANGPSSVPAVGADNKHTPGCIAFVSAASNLVPHDTNGTPDAFAFFPDSGTTIRVSVRGKGKQLNGTATAVTVNGRCTQFAFADDATNVARRAPAGVSQIYLRNLVAKHTITVVVKRHGHKRRRRKTVIGPVTSLVSAHARQPGNGNSSAPVFATFTNDLAFASRATNLAAGTGGFSQVYGAGPRIGALRLLSATSSGQPGDGDSDQPALAQNGKSFGFRTRARNLGSPGPAQVVYSREGGPLGDAGPAASADQGHPSVVNRGHYIVFENGPQVVFWGDVGNVILLLSRDSQQNPLQLPAIDPSPAEALNYVAFETNDPFADHDFADTQPGWNSDPQGTRQRAAQDPTYHQVYLRYFGGSQ